MSGRFALYKKAVRTKCYEMDYFDLHNRVQQVDVMNSFCYAQTHILIFTEVMKVLSTESKRWNTAYLFRLFHGLKYPPS